MCHYILLTSLITERQHLLARFRLARSGDICLHHAKPSLYEQCAHDVVRRPSLEGPLGAEFDAEAVCNGLQGAPPRYGV
jgi:hypothetical protein